MGGFSFKERASRVADVSLTIDGEEAVARPVAAIVWARIVAAHPAPGVPTEPDQSGRPVPQPSSPKYVGLLERHADERVVLEVAAMLGFTAERQGRVIDVRTSNERQDALDWVHDALNVVGTRFTSHECRYIRSMVDNASFAVAERAKNSSASTPPSTG